MGKTGERKALSMLKNPYIFSILSKFARKLTTCYNKHIEVYLLAGRLLEASGFSFDVLRFASERKRSERSRKKGAEYLTSGELCEAKA